MTKVKHSLSVRPGRRRGWLPLNAKGTGSLLLILGAAFSITGCASPVTLYHRAEGGDIASSRQPPPGWNLPYPNLASIPTAPTALTPSAQEAVRQQLLAARAAPEQPDGAPETASHAGLAGLTLPGAAPSLPNVPGIRLQAPPRAVAPPVTVAAAAVPPDGPPILLAFRRKSAILSNDARTALVDLALARGSARIRVAGFGERVALANAAPDAAALTLALHRARRIADALTAAGVPPTEITLTAAATGSGGFAQLVY